MIEKNGAQPRGKSPAESALRAAGFVRSPIGVWNHPDGSFITTSRLGRHGGATLNARDTYQNLSEALKAWEASK